MNSDELNQTRIAALEERIRGLVTRVPEGSELLELHDGAKKLVVDCRAALAAGDERKAEAIFSTTVGLMNLIEDRCTW